MGLALATFAIDLSYSYRDYAAFLNILRCLQLMATISLLFGLLKKDALHKDKFVLFWLIVSSFLFSFLCYFCIIYIGGELFDFYDFIDFVGQFFLLCLIVGLTVLMGYLLYFVYQKYVELCKDIAEAAAAQVQVPNPIVQSKDPLPSYDQLNVTIQN
ncbi:hypothetical protein AWZ03_001915 [Drosophila navojoa]|uniref:Uncharacterized protein n=2 Tax=Drosophila navojoa TaxID=7232 RepID=A0A484BVA4_DRONA|nr:hypothetical protein AWZ03_001915 [Drosophila navojoa]